MTEEFEEEALRYLLDEMDGPRRAAFEEGLARDPVARAALKASADALARFACDTAPAEPMAPVDQRMALAAILSAAKSAPPRASAPLAASNVIPWARYFWPVAAALLLGLNLLNFERPIEPVPPVATGENRQEVGEAVREEVASGSPGETLSAEPLDAPDGQGPVAPVGMGMASTGPSNAIRSARVRELQSELTRLRGAYASLERTNAALRADYESVMTHIAQRAIAERGLGRLAAMELVDAASYAQGNRKGLVELARGILTEPGVVAVDRTASPVLPPPEGVDQGGRGPTNPGFTGVDPSAPAPTVAAVPGVPYAWSVFDENESRGYLNLYNLPEVAADGVLQLWVKGPEATTYQHVGEVPAEFQGGNGSLLYTLPDTAPAPVEILVTEEVRGAAPAVPSGMVVLRGP